MIILLNAKKMTAFCTGKSPSHSVSYTDLLFVSADIINWDEC
jgi:hypothetical protein